MQFLVVDAGLAVTTAPTSVALPGFRVRLDQSLQAEQHILTYPFPHCYADRVTICHLRFALGFMISIPVHSQ